MLFILEVLNIYIHIYTVIRLCDFKIKIFFEFGLLVYVRKIYVKVIGYVSVWVF